MPVRPHRHALGEARAVVAALSPRARGVRAEDKTVLPGFTYYLQGGAPVSYPGSGDMLTSVPPFTPAPPVNYSDKARWYRYDNRLFPEQTTTPVFQNGWFRMASGGAAPFRWLQMSSVAGGSLSNNILVNANGNMTLFWRGKISSLLSTNAIVGIGPGGRGGGQFFWGVTGSTVSVDSSYIANVVNIPTVVPRNQDVVLALRRTGTVGLGTWSVYVDGALTGSASSTVSVANSDPVGTPGLAIGMLRPPSDAFSVVVFFDGWFQSFLAYNSALSDADILTNAERLALWGPSPP